MKIFQPIISGSLNVFSSPTASVIVSTLPTSSAITNVVLYDTASGKLFYTASSGIGGGSGVGVGFPFSGSAVITGSLLVSGSGLRVIAENQTTLPFSISGSTGIELRINDEVGKGLIFEDPNEEARSITYRNVFEGDIAETQLLRYGIYFYDSSSFGIRTTELKYRDAQTGSANILYLPLTAGSQRNLAISVNGQFADTSGSITLSTIPTASYINPLSQSVNITGSLFVSDVTYQSNQQIVSWNQSTKRLHYMSAGDLVVFPYTGSAIFTASVASLPVIDLKGNMAITGTIGFASQSSITELRGIYIGNEASASFSSGYTIQFPSGTISTPAQTLAPLEINDVVKPIIRLNTSTTDFYGPQIQFFRTRATTAVQANQELGELRFHSAYTNSPQTRYGRSAQILVVNSRGTATETSTPARMLFATTPSGSVIPRVRLQIEDNGNVGIGSFTGSAVTASATLHVSGSNIIFDIPSKANGYILQSDANGGATWVAPSTTTIFPYTGSALISGSLVVTGSILISGSITGSLLGTASLATNATNVSVTDNSTTNDTYYITFVGNTSGNQTIRVDSSTLTYNPSTNILRTTASLAQTASNITGGTTGYIPKWSGNTTLGSSVIYQNINTNKIGIGTTSPTYLTHIYSSNSNQILKVEGSGSSNPIFLVQGSQGELFSVTDNISGSLFSVNDNSGLPIIDVMSDSTVLMGNYSAPSLNTTVKLYKISTTESLYRIETGSYDAAFVEFYFTSGSNYGSGYFISSWSGSSVVSDGSYRSITGTPPDFVCNISGGYAELQVQSVNNGHLIKAIIRAI